MRAISLYQPWASLIAEGVKTIETRLHDRFTALVGQRVAIHAGLKNDRQAWKSIVQVLPSGDLRDSALKICRNLDVLPHGCVVCTASVVSAAWIDQDIFEYTERVGQKALIDCYFTKRFGLWLIDIVKNAPILPCKGKQGIFEV
jgi:hypothetical protein